LVHGADVGARSENTAKLAARYGSAEVKGSDKAPAATFSHAEAACLAPNRDLEDRALHIYITMETVIIFS
jgi:hypothetical protein